MERIDATKKRTLETVPTEANNLNVCTETLHKKVKKETCRYFRSATKTNEFDYVTLGLDTIIHSDLKKDPITKPLYKGPKTKFNPPHNISITFNVDCSEINNETVSQPDHSDESKSEEDNGTQSEKLSPCDNTRVDVSQMQQFLQSEKQDTDNYFNEQTQVFRCNKSPIITSSSEIDILDIRPSCIPRHHDLNDTLKSLDSVTHELENFSLDDIVLNLSPIMSSKNDHSLFCKNNTGMSELEENEHEHLFKSSISEISNSSSTSILEELFNEDEIHNDIYSSTFYEPDFIEHVQLDVVIRTETKEIPSLDLSTNASFKNDSFDVTTARKPQLSERFPIEKDYITASPEIEEQKEESVNNNNSLGYGNNFVIKQDGLESYSNKLVDLQTENNLVVNSSSMNLKSVVKDNLEIDSEILFNIKNNAIKGDSKVPLPNDPNCFHITLDVDKDYLNSSLKDTNLFKSINKPVNSKCSSKTISDNVNEVITTISFLENEHSLLTCLDSESTAMPILPIKLPVSCEKFVSSHSSANYCDQHDPVSHLSNHSLTISEEKGNSHLSDDNNSQKDIKDFDINTISDVQPSTELQDVENNQEVAILNTCSNIMKNDFTDSKYNFLNNCDSPKEVESSTNIANSEMFQITKDPVDSLLKSLDIKNLSKEIQTVDSTDEENVLDIDFQISGQGDEHNSSLENSFETLDECLIDDSQETPQSENNNVQKGTFDSMLYPCSNYTCNSQFIKTKGEESDNKCIANSLLDEESTLNIDETNAQLEQKKSIYGTITKSMLDEPILIVDETLHNVATNNHSTSSSTVTCISKHENPISRDITKNMLDESSTIVNETVKDLTANLQLDSTNIFNLCKAKREYSLLEPIIILDDTVDDAATNLKLDSTDIFNTHICKLKEKECVPNNIMNETNNSTQSSLNCKENVTEIPSRDLLSNIPTIKRREAPSRSKTSKQSTDKENQFETKPKKRPAPESSNDPNNKKLKSLLDIPKVDYEFSRNKQPGYDFSHYKEIQEYADNNDIRWSNYNLKTPEERFQSVCDQWGFGCLPDPHQELTQRYLHRPLVDEQFTRYLKPNNFHFMEAYKKSFYKAENKLRQCMYDIGVYQQQHRNRFNIRNLEIRLAELKITQDKIIKAQNEACQFYQPFNDIGTGWNATFLCPDKLLDIENSRDIMNFNSEFYGN